MSWEDLERCAAAIEVDPTTVYRWAQGVVKPRHKKAGALIQYFRADGLDYNGIYNEDAAPNIAHEN
jgi:DNA-binding XRE family transcriptional regulator